nr:MAG TPA: hypothetical protein [Caudoviricetes sp.]
MQNWIVTLNTCIGLKISIKKFFKTSFFNA